VEDGVGGTDTGGRTGGNIIHLVRELKGLGYKDAIDYILDYTVGNRYEARVSDDSRRLKQKSHTQIRAAYT
jgi:hypothetical protein